MEYNLEIRLVRHNCAESKERFLQNFICNLTLKQDNSKTEQKSK